jgi:hypothetical protein
MNGETILRLIKTWLGIVNPVLNNIYANQRKDAKFEQINT